MGGRGWALVILLATLVATPAAAAQDAPWVTGESEPENLRIFVVTVGPGEDENFGLFGHSAIIVEDRLTGHEQLYNYGTRPINNSMTAVKVAFGAADFMLSENDVDKSFQLYQDVDREIRIQELNLTPSERMEMASEIGHDLEPGNRTYAYNYFFENCSTKIRDILNRVLDGAVRNQTQELTDETIRSAARTYMADRPLADVVTMMMVNGEHDDPMTEWEAMYLPNGLEAQLETLEVEGPNGTTRPIVEDSLTVYESDFHVAEEPATRWPYTLGLGLAVGLAALALGLRARSGGRARQALHGVTSLAGLVLGVAGVTLLGGWLFTGHGIFAWNENLLLASPVALAGTVYGVRALLDKGRPRRHLLAWIVAAAPVLLALPLELASLMPQANTMHVALFAPMALGAAAGQALSHGDRLPELLPWA